MDFARVYMFLSCCEPRLFEMPQHLKKKKKNPVTSSGFDFCMEMFVVYTRLL